MHKCNKANGNYMEFIFIPQGSYLYTLCHNLTFDWNIKDLIYSATQRFCVM